MPANIVKTAHDEVLWERAKAAVLPHADRYRQPYAVVTYVFEKMKAAEARGESICPHCAHKMFDRFHRDGRRRKNRR